MYAAPSIQKLLDELERLPGVGPKSAQRIAYWILNADKATALRLSDAIAEVKETVRFCSRCFNYAEDDLCEICQSSKRDAGIICVVSEPRDIPPIERTAVYNGVYHVLGGALSPMEGIGPDELRIAQLMKRLASDEVREVVLATNPNVEGETTATYLARLIKPLGIAVPPAACPSAATSSSPMRLPSAALSKPDGRCRGGGQGSLLLSLASLILPRTYRSERMKYYGTYGDGIDG